MADAIIQIVDRQVIVQPFGSELLAPFVVEAAASAAAAEAAKVETEAAEAIVEAVTPRVGALEGVAGIAGPGLGLIRGTTLLIESAWLDAVGRPIRLTAVPEGDYVADDAGDFFPIVPPAGEAVALDSDGPMLGMLPDTTELIVRALLDRVFGTPLQLTGDGSDTGYVTQLTLTPTGLLPSGGGGGGSTDPDAEPVVFDAGGPDLVVPSGQGEIGGQRLIQWATTTITSAATTSDVETDFPVTAGVNAETLLDHEEIVSVQEVRLADSPFTVQTEDEDYTVDLARGIIKNLTAAALVIDYTGSRQKKGVVAVDVVTGGVAHGEGPEKARNASLYTPGVSNTQIIIGHTLRKGPHFWYMPCHDFYDGVKRTDWPRVIQELERNRPILKPVSSSDDLSALFVWTSRGAFGSADPGADDFNDTPNSRYNDFVRDGPFYNNFSTADYAALGLEPGGADDNLFSFDEVPGFNLTGGTPDGFGKTHLMGSAPWTVIKGLHAFAPKRKIRVFNHSIPGTGSGTGFVNGFANVLEPVRFDAVIARIETEVALGRTVLVFANDGMNDIGNPDFYDNVVTFNQAAMAAGAIVHLFGVNRPDPRWIGNQDAAVAVLQQELVRAAWDTGAAVTDSWPIIGPNNVRGTGLHEDEVMAANGANHDHPYIHEALGRHALRSYV